MRKKAYIYVREVFEDSKNEMESILPFEFNVKLPPEGEKDIQKALENSFEKDIISLMEYYETSKSQYGMKASSFVIKEIKPVYIKKRSRYYKGEYYAHEYGQYADGKVRKIEYSNGFCEYEVVCLNKELDVLDGAYSVEDCYGDKYQNGFGDYLRVLEETPWSKKERLEREKKRAK